MNFVEDLGSDEDRSILELVSLTGSTGQVSFWTRHLRFKMWGGKLRLSSTCEHGNEQLLSVARGSQVQTLPATLILN